MQRNANRFCLDSLKGRHHSEDLVINGRTEILEEIQQEGVE
jgi:hypothetical protein